MLTLLAEKANSWAGIPMPLEDENLVIDSKYPHAEIFMALEEVLLQRKETEKPKEGYPIKNSFWSFRYKSDIHLFDLPDGKIGYEISPGANHLRFDLRTLSCSEAWGLEQESKALELLGSLLSAHKFKQYLLTGTFLETSPRSGLTYMFRKLKPTVVLHEQRVGSFRWGPKTFNDNSEMLILCALCMHPIAYYAESWAGAMCPTDDVIAHLMMLRGDEAMFWRRANQHPAYRPQAGI